MKPEVREEILDWIVKPENSELLETLKLIKEHSQSGDWFNSLSESQKESIERGMNDLRKGRTLTSREFWDKRG